MPPPVESAFPAHNDIVISPDTVNIAAESSLIDVSMYETYEEFAEEIRKVAAPVIADELQTWKEVVWTALASGLQVESLLALFDNRIEFLRQRRD